MMIDIFLFKLYFLFSFHLIYIKERNKLIINKEIEQHRHKKREVYYLPLLVGLVDSLLVSFY